MIVGAIEGGGTKFVCAVLKFDDSNIQEKPPRILKIERILTTDPESTLDAVVRFFKNSGIECAGLGMFGPIECRIENPRWGYLLKTPKPGWSDIDIAQRLQKQLQVPLKLETDVAASGIGEWKWGAGRGTHCCVYITIGTGIGAGIIIDGIPVRASFHPEMGHMRVPRARTIESRLDEFEGICIYHSDCLEGLASGPAIAARWREAPENLPTEHPAWRLEAEYLAFALTNIALTIAPDRIIVGGGIGLREGLLDMVGKRMRELLGGYIQALSSAEAIRLFLARAKLGNEAGVLGAAELARQLFNSVSKR
ncbi:MAG TPA: ROK family protein [Rectinema sp.]|jgi:fructokinase|nr:ROK family protein [Spirochaetia bacterium]HQK09063.1 ROK family protein [Rectinema sp.]HRR37960.1 ROK family protein [Rectinema sp.]